MSQLKAILDQQQNKLTSKDSSGLPQEALIELIRFDSESITYVVPISSVREIAHSSRVVPYPEVVPGHLGVISLRGEILPTLSLQNTRQQSQDDRIIVLEFEEGKPFCLLASNIRKVFHEKDTLASQKVTKIDGRAAHVLGKDHFSAFSGGGK